MNSSPSLVKTRVASLLYNENGYPGIVETMTFYRGRVDCGKLKWPPEKLKELDEVEGFPAEAFLKQLLEYKVTSISINRQIAELSKGFSRKRLERLGMLYRLWQPYNNPFEALSGDLANVFTRSFHTALPGDVIIPFCEEYLFPKVTGNLCAKIKRRRDEQFPWEEDTLFNTEEEEEEVGEGRLLELCKVIAKWFDIEGYFVEELWKKGEGLSESQAAIEIITVDIPLAVIQDYTRGRVYRLNPYTADWDDLLRCLEVIYFLAVDDGTKKFEKQVIDKLAKIFTPSPDGTRFLRWRDPTHMYDLLNRDDRLLVYNLLLGNKEAVEVKDVSVDTLIDLANLFKYIDIYNGSFFWLDVLSQLRFESPQYINRAGRRKNSNLVNVAYGFTALDLLAFLQHSDKVNKLSFTHRRKCAPTKACVWFSPLVDGYVVYDFIRRYLGDGVAKEVRDYVTKRAVKLMSQRQDFKFIQDKEQRDFLTTDQVRSMVQMMKEELIQKLPSWLDVNGASVRRTTIFIAENECPDRFSTVNVKTEVIKGQIEAVMMMTTIYEMVTGLDVPREVKVKSWLAEELEVDVPYFYATSYTNRHGIGAIPLEELSKNRLPFHGLLELALIDIYCLKTREAVTPLMLWRDLKGCKTNFDRFLEIFRRYIFVMEMEVCQFRLLVKAIAVLFLGVGASYSLFSDLEDLYCDHEENCLFNIPPREGSFVNQFGTDRMEMVNNLLESTKSLDIVVPGSIVKDILLSSESHVHNFDLFYVSLTITSYQDSEWVEILDFI